MFVKLENGDLLNLDAISYIQRDTGIVYWKTQNDGALPNIKLSQEELEGLEGGMFNKFKNLINIT